MLIQCFAGCPPLHVLESIGLTFSDLFEKSPGGAPVPRDWRIQKNARSTLEAIELPVITLMLGANQAIKGTLTKSEHRELSDAFQMISQALYVAGIRPKAIAQMEREVARG